MSAVKEGCRKAFQAQPQRLMAAMYTCHINAKAQVLGKFFLKQKQTLKYKIFFMFHH